MHPRTKFGFLGIGAIMPLPILGYSGVEREDEGYASSGCRALLGPYWRGGS